MDDYVEDEGEMPYVGNIRPLVGPAKGDGDLGPGAIARVGDGIFNVDGEHPAGGELSISSTLEAARPPKMVVTTLS